MYKTSADAHRTGLVLGAIIVILSVALDPFSQQLIQIDWRLSFRDSTLATVPVAKRYSKGFRFIAAGKLIIESNIKAHTLSLHWDD